MDVRVPGGEQAKLWNGPAGQAWVDTQDLLDHTLKPVEVLLVDAALAASAVGVLDIGCGTGGTTLAVARRLGPGAACTGIDVSQPMIAAARRRTQREGTAATFICANAQDYAFEPAGFDMFISRFGVMFFDDPVRAFANLRRAARDGAGLCCIAFRSPAENPFMTTAEREAAPLLPNLRPRRPGAPGQFAFADSRHVETILRESGWNEIDIRPIDLEFTLPEKDLLAYLMRLGPVGLALHEADDHTRARVAETIRPAFDEYVHGAEVRFTGACWMIGGRAPKT